MKISYGIDPNLVYPRGFNSFLSLNKAIWYWWFFEISCNKPTCGTCIQGIFTPWDQRILWKESRDPMLWAHNGVTWMFALQHEHGCISNSCWHNMSYMCSINLRLENSPGKKCIWKRICQIHQIRWIKYKYKYMAWYLIKYKYKYKYAVLVFVFANTNTYLTPALTGSV